MSYEIIDDDGVIESSSDFDEIYEKYAKMLSPKEFDDVTNKWRGELKLIKVLECRNDAIEGWNFSEEEEENDEELRMK